MEKVYTASATAVGGRIGKVRTSDGALDLQLETPGAIGVVEKHATNPEQLFAAGYASCFCSALRLVARQKHIKSGEVSVTVDITIGKDSDGGFALSADIHAVVPGVDKETAQELAEGAHNMCPYSKATRGNMPTTISVSVD